MSSSNTAAAPAQDTELPDVKVLTNAIKLSITEDKPIKMDYWKDSLQNKCMIGERSYVDEEDGQTKQELLLVKSKDEYTSSIENSYKCKGCYIMVTHFSIYIVSASIQTCRIA